VEARNAKPSELSAAEFNLRHVIAAGHFGFGCSRALFQRLRGPKYPAAPTVAHGCAAATIARIGYKFLAAWPNPSVKRSRPPAAPLRRGAKIYRGAPAGGGGACRWRSA
jgi:hypothetical protein